MIEANMPKEQIAKITELSMDEIIKIEQNIKKAD